MTEAKVPASGPIPGVDHEPEKPRLRVTKATQRLLREVDHFLDGLLLARDASARIKADGRRLEILLAAVGLIEPSDMEHEEDRALVLPLRAFVARKHAEAQLVDAIHPTVIPSARPAPDEARGEHDEAEEGS